MNEQSFADLSYEIASEIGRDVDYVRTQSDASGERLYMTGIELGLLLATAATISFLKGMVKGIGTSTGQATGKAIGDALLSKLSQLLGHAMEVERDDVPKVKEELDALHSELDGAVRHELRLVVSKRLYVDGRIVADQTARLDVQSTLESFGLPKEKAAVHAAATTTMLGASMLDLLQ